MSDNDLGLAVLLIENKADLNAENNRGDSALKVGLNIHFDDDYFPGLKKRRETTLKSFLSSGTTEALADGATATTSDSAARTTVLRD